ncbi:hypothetical protein LCGC14_2455580 [marine sediment metagenome]|uniref:Uncharacterized protein n=1 Tax=marine sediment metagenome TaxID=412755 RepID=A0A0F9BER3_9ZZZZ
MNTKRTPFLPKRLGPRSYTVVCEAGHYYGMLNAPQNDQICCVEAMAEALINEVERLWEQCEAAG